MVLFFVHIPFVVNHAFSTTPTERLQQHPSFLQQTAPIARSLCEGCTWHDLHILVTAPFCSDRKSRTACAQSFALWQQATIDITCHIHSIIACSRQVCTGAVLRAHPVRGESHIQRQRRDCNNRSERFQKREYATQEAILGLCKPAMPVGPPEIFTSHIVPQTQYVVVTKLSLLSVPDGAFRGLRHNCSRTPIFSIKTSVAYCPDSTRVHHVK